MWCGSLVPGNSFLYFTFAFVVNLYLFLGFSKKKIFFDSFLSVFFWLGFWLKITFRTIFYEGKFNESVGNYSGEPGQFNEAMLVIICGILPLITLSLIRRKLFSAQSRQEDNSFGLSHIERFYFENRTLTLTCYITFVLLITTSNVYFHIYQRGTIPPQNLPFVIYGVYAWLVSFGLSSVAALFLHFEIQKKEYPLFNTLLFIFESFLSSTSILSRGMILNSSAGLFGVLSKLIELKKRIRLKYLLLVTGSFIVLFGISISMVNTLRLFSYSPVEIKKELSVQSIVDSNEKVKLLFIDRWVGAEGVLSVASYPKKDWGIFKSALKEKMRNGSISVYDSTFIESSYNEVDFSKHHFISIPGIIAFLYYPGKFWFVFLGMTFVGLIGWGFESFFITFSGRNFVLTSLLSQIVAFRFTHFGYVPSQSYQLFGTLIITIGLFYITDKTLMIIYRKEDQLLVDLE